MDAAPEYGSRHGRELALNLIMGSRKKKCHFQIAPEVTKGDSCRHTLCMLWKAGRGCAIRPWPGPPGGNGLWLFCPGKSDVLEARCRFGLHSALLTPDADLGGICRDLEAALPELCGPAKACRGARSGASANGPAGGPMTVLSGLLRRGQTVSLGLSPRKLELRALLAACGLSIALGFTGNGARPSGGRDGLRPAGRASCLDPAQGLVAYPRCARLSVGRRSAYQRRICGSEKGRQMPTPFGVTQPV